VQTVEVVTIILTQSVIFLFGLGLAYFKIRRDVSAAIEKDIHARRIERLERQLSEFYGPLYMLTQAKRAIVEESWGTDIWWQIRVNTVWPMHEEIEKILLNKIGLLHETDVPKSFIVFLQHFRVDRCYDEDDDLGKYFEKGIPYPQSFDDDIKTAYLKKRAEYDAEVLKLGHTASHSQSNNLLAHNQ
jgi:hypothetical protein